MTFWCTGDEECADQDWITNPTAKGVYDLMGSFVMSQIRNRRGDQVVPEDWFVPDWFLASIRGGKRAASYMVGVGKLKRVRGGYRFLYIQPGNTPEAVRKLRKHERDKKSAQRSGGTE